MKPKHPKFNPIKLNRLIDDYFIHIEGEQQPENSAAVNKLLRPAEPATITGLALFLGFASLKEFEDYEQTGKHAVIARRGRLRVEAEYEKRLHQQSPAGAIFALKSMGWNEKADSLSPATPSAKTLKIKLVESGPKPATTEKDVIL